MSDQEPDLVEQLRRRVTEWVTRVAPRIRDEQALAKLEITLQQPQGDDDGTLYLDFELVETTVPSSGGGRVPGFVFWCDCGLHEGRRHSSTPQCPVPTP